MAGKNVQKKKRKRGMAVKNVQKKKKEERYGCQEYSEEEKGREVWLSRMFRRRKRRGSKDVNIGKKKI